MLTGIEPEGKTLTDLITLRGYVAGAKLQLTAYVKDR